MKSPRDVIIRPIVSEKSYAGIEQNTYTFLVDQRANKTEIKEAIQTDLERPRALGEHPEPQGQGEAHAVHRPASGPTRSAPSSPSPRATPSRSSRARDVAMAVRKYKPTTPGAAAPACPGSTRSRAPSPRSRCSRKRAKKAGRNVHGRITTRHQGGGHKRRYRIIDFRRNKDGVPAKVAHIEYDPNRSARIALLHYADGEKRYILAPQGLEVGDRLDVRARRRHPSRQRAAAARTSRSARCVHAVELKPGARRQDGAVRPAPASS